MSDTDYTQLKLHDKWKKDPSTYVKPPGDPLATRKANMVHSTQIKEDLSYILFVDGEIQAQRGSASTEFLEMDPEPLRKATLHMKARPGFHVYYKQGPYWYGVKEHFSCLADTIPYIHSGLRVLIEYRFSVMAVKYIVYPGYETGPNGEQGAFRSADQLCELFGVSPTDCVFAEYSSYLPPHGPLIQLKPLWQPDWKLTPRTDYDLQRRSLKHFGKLAPTKL